MSACAKRRCCRRVCRRRAPRSARRTRTDLPSVCSEGDRRPDSICETMLGVSPPSRASWRCCKLALGAEMLDAHRRGPSRDFLRCGAGVPEPGDGGERPRDVDPRDSLAVGMAEVGVVGGLAGPAARSATRSISSRVTRWTNERGGRLLRPAGAARRPRPGRSGRRGRCHRPSGAATATPSHRGSRTTRGAGA